MEAVVLKALSNVDSFNAGSFFEAADVEDEFVGAAGVGVRIEDRVVGAEARHDVVCIKEGDLSGVSQASSTC